MPVLRLDELAAFDCALDGIGLHLEPFNDQNPYKPTYPDLILEELNIGDELTENKLDTLKWSSNRSLHEGAGQKRADASTSSEFRFLSSKGIDVVVPGEATLLKATSRIDTIVHSLTPQRIVVANDNLFVVTAAPNLRKHTILTGPGANISTGSESGTVQTQDLATDGQNVYIALGAEGVHRILAGGASGAHYSDADVERLEWAKGSLWGLGLSAGQYQLLEIASGTGSVQKHLFEGGETPIQMAELGPLLYIAMQTGPTSSAIYAYDGDKAPFIALPADAIPGHVITSMTPFLGAGMLIGAKRYVSPTQNVGVLFAAFPSGTGHLVLLERPITTLGTPADGADYTIGRGVAFSPEEIMFCWPRDDASGLGVYFPSRATYARHLYQNTGSVGIVNQVVVWRGRRCFTVRAQGLYVEQETFLASGEVISSVIDVNLDAEKLWLLEESGFEALAAGTKVRHEFSIDGGVIWQGLAEATTTGATLLQTAIRSAGEAVKSAQIQYRVTLFSDVGGTLAPVWRKSGIGSWPAQKPRAVHELYVRALPLDVLRTGVQDDIASAGWDLLLKLITRRNTGLFYPFQTPFFKYDQINGQVDVRIADLIPVGPWGTTGPREGGLIFMRLKEVPA